MIKGTFLSSCHKLFNDKILNTLFQDKGSFVQVRNFAARKGYRDAAKKKKVKTVIKKQGWIPQNLRKKAEKGGPAAPLKLLEHNLDSSIDDVWLITKHSWRVYDFKEAVGDLSQSHHPTMFNVPDAQINVFIELDMRTAKPTRFVEKFSRMAILPHVYEQDGLLERSILVFCKTPEQKEEALNAGANLVGGVEIIKEIEKGKIVLPDFKFVIAHPTILPEMVTIRGLLKRKFPTIKSGTMGPNIGELVTQFKNGVEYSCKKHESEVDYGTIETTIGRLNMEAEKLEENLTALLQDVNNNRPKRPGPFVTRLLMYTPFTNGPFVEKYKINLTPYITEEEVDGESSDEDEAVTARS